jgi:hypothetical protein
METRRCPRPCHDDFFVTEVFDAVFYAQGHHHVVELFVFIDFCAFFAKDVLGFTAEAENRLGVGIPAGYDGTTG